MAAKTAVATRDIESKELTSAEMPSYLAEMERKPIATGDNFDSEDVAIPRIKMLQATSKECETFDGARPGVFWHTGLDMPLGKELRFVVCSRNKKYLLVAPLEDGQGILARADDAKTWDQKGKWVVKYKDRAPETWEIADLDVAASGLDKWGTSRHDDKNSPPAATLFYDYLVLLPDHPDLGPSVLSLTRSAIKPAKKGLNDKVKIHMDNGRPMQALVFMAKSAKETNNNGQEFWNYQFVSDGFVADKDFFDQAMELSSALRTFKVADEEGTLKDEDGSGKKVEDKGGEF